MRARNRFPDVEALAATVSLTANRCSGLKTNTGATGTVIVTLPTAASCRNLPPVTFLRTASQTFTLDPNGTELIRDASGTSLGAGTAKSLSADGAYCVLYSDGTDWRVLDERPAAVADSIVAGMLADGAVDVAAVLASDVVTTVKILGANVTPPKLVGTGMKWGHYVARNGAGAITLTGAVVGDRVLGGWKSGDASDHNTAGEGSVATTATFTTLFEAAITVNDQIQQASASDLSDDKYTVILLPAAS